MKSILLGMTLLFAASPLLTRSVSAQTAADRPAAAANAYTITENYYKTIPGHREEFLQLFMKNHYPLLQRELADGKLVSVKVETPAVYMPEDVRWDYRVTIVSKGDTASNAANEAALKLQLWPDQDAFKREEKQRFDAVLAHWDIAVTDITPPKK